MSIKQMKVSRPEEMDHDSRIELERLRYIVDCTKSLTLNHNVLFRIEQLANQMQVGDNKTTGRYDLAELD